jgi:dTDP-4-amino-4,6-dideoxygalactose transaminase
MGPLLDLGRQYGIPVVEDAAQAIGAEYRGARCGSLGTIGCFSFYPGKNLGGYGDGGLLTTNHDALAEQLRILRVHGGRDKYYHRFVGINSRLDTLQAAVLKVKLRYLDEWTGKRQANAKRYWELLKECPELSLPQVAPYQSRHVFNQYTVLTDKRNELKSYLAGQGIGTEIYYPLPLHLQECFAYLGYRSGQLPVAESCAQQALSLPVHPELATEDLEYVAHQVQSFLIR